MPRTIKMMPQRLITKMWTPYSKGTATVHFSQDQRKFSQKLTRKIVSSQRSEPQNEVSICKFKFTGGPKPTLEEKKMLHIDSEGNFCYTTGSGDRAVTGFEYFPKESISTSSRFVGDVN